MRGREGAARLAAARQRRFSAQFNARFNTPNSTDEWAATLSDVPRDR
jgi:hypothetical protein